MLQPWGQRIKMNVGCLLCALSSSCSSLALADLHVLQLKLGMGKCVHELVVLGRVRISMIQVIIHESGLQTIQINVCRFRTHGAHNLNQLSLTQAYSRRWRPNLWNTSNYSAALAIGPMRRAEVKLIGLEVIAMKEDDGLGCGVVDFNNSCCLYRTLNTYFIDFFSFITSVNKWNFFCCVILLYL